MVDDGEEHYGERGEEVESVVGNSNKRNGNHNATESHGYDHYSYDENDDSYNERKDEYQDRYENKHNNANDGDYDRNLDDDKDDDCVAIYENAESEKNSNKETRNRNGRYECGGTNKSTTTANTNTNTNNPADHNQAKNPTSISNSTKRDVHNIRNTSTSSTTSSKLRKRRDDDVIQVLTDADLGI